MEEVKIKTGTLLLISLSISFLINLNRFLFIVYPDLSYFKDVAAGSIPVFLFRFISFGVYCLIVLYLSVHSKKYLERFSKLVRVLVFIVIIIAVPIATFYLIMWVHHLVLFEVVEPEREGIRYVWVVMCITSVLIGGLLVFQRKQKISVLEKEQLKKENIQNELVALNNQINPHFLFNSLNTLKYIIETNPKGSIVYVDHLASLYRYILQSKDKGLVTLQQELQVLEAYIRLARIRFGDNFNVNMQLSIHTKTTLIPKLSLQLLIENAIKHNEVSEEFPLIIDIYNEDDSIVVKNKIQLKSKSSLTTAEGLKNLNKRFELLKNKAIKIDVDTYFIVKLPIH
ncbi:sensor histidine kinase [Aquimarina aggregata]|uniref:sensor histidine kinase n=1 Tax=Aquimarina aggregata TaxID=1642818 RepID=UPI00249195C5|nr:histidine kinase [Aquimarina aggregata]